MATAGKKFYIVNDFGKGYRNKVDVTKEEPGVAVAGSQNIQIIGNNKIGNRPGFSYLGTRSTDPYGIIDGGAWKTNTAVELALRSFSDGTTGSVEVYIGSAWETLIDTLETQGASFLKRGAGVLRGWWDSSEVLDLLLFVDGSSSIYMWSGGNTTFSSSHDDAIGTATVDNGGSGYAVGDTVTVNGGSSLATLTVNTVSTGAVTAFTITEVGNGYSVASAVATTTVTGSGTGFTVNITGLTNSIVKQGTNTWAEDRFLTSGDREIRIKDDSGTWRTFSYTGNEGTTTISGVSPDPTTFTISAGNVILQSVRETAAKPGSGSSNDFLQVYLNYLFVFDTASNTVNASKNTDYTDFSAPSSPRLPGEAIVVTLDETPTAAITQPDGDALFIHTKNQIYRTVFTPSADLTKEEVTVEPLKTSALEGATNEKAVTNMKNYVVFITGEPTVDNLGRIENIDTPQSVPLSDPIKDYIDVAGVQTATAFYYKNDFYTALREDAEGAANNRILIRNLETGAWETPWTIPASVIFEYAGDLYAHDPATKNTYKLLDTNYADNYVSNAVQAPIAARWYSSHDDFGYPDNVKKFNIFFIDGYIRANTELDIIFTYDFSETKKFTLTGLDENVIIQQTGGGLGYYSLGNRNLGGRGETLSETGLRRFRGFFAVPVRPFYELQVSFQSEQAGARWEICQYGMNISMTQQINQTLKIS